MLDVAGARSLMAAILINTHKDCMKPYNSREGRTARLFLNSDWCQDLCEALDIDYYKYKEVSTDPIRKKRIQQVRIN